jgi:phosphohistidine phosphatase
MRLYVVRHGDAVVPPGGRERSLTPRGERDAEAAGELLAQQGLDYLLHSPKLRAHQTAELILEAFDGLGHAAAPSLVPPSTGQLVVEAVERTGARRVALVSHMPLVAYLVGWFTSGEYSHYPLPGFPEAGIVALDADIPARGLASVAWYAFPPDYTQQRG